MKRMWKDIIFALLLGVLAPVIIVGVALAEPKQPQPAPETTETTETTAPAAFTLPILQTDGTLKQMELDTYLTGVVLQEMPAEFEPEALKAQAVVARTYALRRNTIGEKHPGGAVCTDAACCQAYISPEDYISAGGTAENLEKVRNAVDSTSGEVLCYEGALIEATYFSCSGGRTEDAAAVWGADVPYLQAVDSPGEEEAAHYTDTVTFTAEEFSAALGIAPEGLPATWLGEVSYTHGGGVAAMEICGTAYEGTVLRQKLDLRSTAFTMTAAGDHIIVTTKGFGHRVGMSQYGADAMAVAGDDYARILSHYYPGTELVDWIDKGGVLE